MRSTTSRKWSKKDDEYIKANLAQGTIALATRFNVSPAALRKRVFGLGLSLKKPKEVIIKPTKANSLEKFNPSHHKIKNSSTAGKIPFEIKSERMIVYLTPEQNNDKYKQSVVNKYATRHKPIT